MNKQIYCVFSLLFAAAASPIAGKADEWLAKHAAGGSGEPFFLYYAIPAPHAPWATASEFKGKSGAGQYGDYVMNVDAMVGQVTATLDRLKLKDNTLVFFSSDNGPVWYRQDIEKFGHRAAGPWKGMQGDLTEAGHHMPLIARWPRKIKAGSVCGELNYGSYTLAVREGDWKLSLPSGIYAVKDGAITPDHIVETTGKGPNDKFQLYNLRTDPGEATNLFAQEPYKAKELLAALKADLERGRSRP